MKITCLKAMFANGINTVARTTPTQSTITESLDVLIEENNGQLKLSCTNLDLGISVSTWLSANLEGEGAIAVPSRMLNNLVKSLPDGELVMEIQQEPLSLVVLSAGSNARMLGHAADRFPRPNDAIEEDQGDFLRVPRNVIRDSLNRSAKASATEDTRPVLTGIKMDVEGSTYKVASADGYRLAVDSDQLESSAKEPFGIVIPRKAVHDLVALLEDGSEEIQFMVTKEKRQVLFRVDNVELTAQLIEGSFPDYDKLLPISSTTEVDIPLKEFKEAIKIATAIVSGGSGIIRLMLTKDEAANQGTMSVEGKSEDIGESKTDIPVKITGDAINVAFNCRYLSDLLDVVEGESIKLSSTSPSSPALFTTTSLPNYKHVIMPMFVQW